jgi:hypothetical protein
MSRSTAARLVINRKIHTLGEDLRDFVQHNVNIKREAAEKNGYMESRYTRKRKKNMMKPSRGTRIKTA